MAAFAKALLDTTWLTAPIAVMLGAVGMFYFILCAIDAPTSDDKATVIQVCRDGTLVLRRQDGEFRVMRPGASHGWHADGPNVCE